MPPEKPGGPSADEKSQYGVNRNLLIKLLGGKGHLPPMLQISEPETILAHEVHTTGNRAAFTCRTPRLSTLAASTAGLLPAPMRHVGAQPSLMPWSGRIESMVIHDPQRQSCSFISQPRYVQPPVRRALLRATVLEGLPAYHGHLSPRRSLPASPRLRHGLRPIGF